MKLALAIIGEYLMTIVHILGFIVLLPVVLISLIILQITEWLDI